VSSDTLILLVSISTIWTYLKMMWNFYNALDRVNELEDELIQIDLEIEKTSC